MFVTLLWETKGGLPPLPPDKCWSFEMLWGYVRSSSHVYTVLASSYNRFIVRRLILTGPTEHAYQFWYVRRA